MNTSAGVWTPSRRVLDSRATLAEGGVCSKSTLGEFGAQVIAANRDPIRGVAGATGFAI